MFPYHTIPSTQQLLHMSCRPMNVSKGWGRVLTSCVCGVSRLWPLGFQQLKWGTLWSWTHQRGAARIKDPPVSHRICSSHHSTDPRPAYMGDSWGCVRLPGFYTLLGTHAHAYMDVHAHAVIMFLSFSHHAMVNSEHNDLQWRKSITSLCC